MKRVLYANDYCIFFYNLIFIYTCTYMHILQFFLFLWAMKAFSRFMLVFSIFFRSSTHSSFLGLSNSCSLCQAIADRAYLLTSFRWNYPLISYVLVYPWPAYSSALYLPYTFIRLAYWKYFWFFHDPFFHHFFNPDQAEIL